jgi:hypothetical protein
MLLIDLCRYIPLLPAVASVRESLPTSYNYLSTN